MRSVLFANGDFGAIDRDGNRVAEGGNVCKAEMIANSHAKVQQGKLHRRLVNYHDFGGCKTLNSRQLLSARNLRGVWLPGARVKGGDGIHGLFI